MTSPSVQPAGTPAERQTWPRWYRYIWTWGYGAGISIRIGGWVMPFGSFRGQWFFPWQVRRLGTKV